MAATAGASEPGAAAASRPSDSGASDLLQFLDGGLLHGELQSMDIQRGVRWRHPAAKDVIEFRPANLALIRFAKSEPMVAKFAATSRFEFANGDEVYGNLKSLEQGELELETTFGGLLSAPRNSARALTFFHEGFRVLYEGPDGLDGWKLERGPRGWQYRDGAFVTKTSGTIGRDLKLSGSSSMEFEVGWTGHFSLSFILYAQSVERFDYSQHCYMFHLSPGYLNVQRVQPGVGVTSLGQAQVPDMLRKGKVRLQIRTNQEDSTIGVWADGVLIERWKDHAGLSLRGSGVVFSSQMDGPEVKISGIRVTDWDGTFEPETAMTGTEDIVYLVNRDKVFGKVEAIRDGKLIANVQGTALEIPLIRVTQVYFAPDESPPVVQSPWEIRVDVAGGGRVSFELQQWTDKRISGRSANFGLVAFNPEAIRAIQFNPHRPFLGRPEPATENEQWDFDE